MRGCFTSRSFRFEIDWSDWVSDDGRTFDEELEDEAFDLRLTATGRIPDLGGAPIASWLLARLARLTDDMLGVDGEESTDGGGYVIEFLVYREPNRTKPAVMQPLLFDMEELGVHIEPERPVASLQLQADMQGVAVLGYRAADCPGEKVLQALADALLAAPDDMMAREIAIFDPEWKEDPEMYKPRPFKGSRNWYGWDGSRFLGRDNIRDADLQA
jgi:hypothetical protein